MTDAPAARLWIGRASFVLIAFTLVFLNLLPLATVPQRWAPPDLLLAIALAWTARRPDYVPALLIAAVFLLSDLLFHRPPGLWTALVLIATEALRARNADLRNVSFALEWMTVAFAVVALTLGNRLILALAMTPQAPLELTMIQMVLTIAIYPLVTLGSRYLFGVSRPAPGAVDSLGHKL